MKMCKNADIGVRKILHGEEMAIRVSERIEVLNSFCFDLL
jgi:hypothetical protein